MSVKGQIKEAAGYVKEETGEKLNNQKMANEGRDLRNEGRLEDNKAPKTTLPGSGKIQVNNAKKAEEEAENE